MEDRGSRAERKERTRQSLLDSTLLLLRERSLASLSLREVARAAQVVPTAFYRHFDSLDELGAALVEESMHTLRHVLRDARRQRTDDDLITGSIAALSDQVRLYAPYFRFLVNERFGGVAGVRRAIESELRLVVSDLVTDLARMRLLHDWSIDDLEMAAELMVNAMLAFVPALLDARRELEPEVASRAEQQLRLIALGMAAAEPARFRPAAATRTPRRSAPPA